MEWFACLSCKIIAEGAILPSMEHTDPVVYRKYQFVGENARDQIAIAVARDRPDVRELLAQADRALSRVREIYYTVVRQNRIAKGYKPPPPLIKFD